MTGIVYPNLAGTLIPLIQMDRQAENDRLNRERMDRHDQLLMDDRRQARDLQQMQVMQSLDDKKRARLKDAAEWTTRATMSVLNAPPDQRSAAYQAALQEGKTLGYDLSNLPQQYSPGMDGMLQFYAGKSADYLKMLENRPTPMGGPSVAAPAGGGSDPMAWRTAIKGNESSGRYDAVGPDTGKGRAYGAYQVMDFNVPTWTAEVLGKPMTPQEFLASPEAQDKVFDAKFGGYVAKYGSPQAAARAWFAGEGGMNNASASDVLGTTVAGYEKRFNAGLGGPQVAQAGGIPVIPQGDAIPPSAPGPQGDVMAQVRGVQLPPGARIMAQKGVPIVKDGTVMILKADGTPDFVPLPPRKDPTVNGGLFPGNSVEANALNQLISRGILSEQQALDLAAGKTITDPSTGQIIFKRPTELVGGAAAPAGATAPGAAPAAPTGGVPLTPAKKEPALKKLETEIRAVESSIDNFQKVITEAGGGSWRAFINDPTSADAQKVLGAFNAMKTALRSEAFINTGVLQPKEMEMLDDMLLSPTSVRGYLATPEGYAAMLDQIRTFVKNKMDAAGVAYGQVAPQTAKPGTYTGPDNKPIPWKEIEDTAKNRGMSPDEVINQLGLKPSGSK